MLYKQPFSILGNQEGGTSSPEAHEEERQKLAQVPAEVLSSGAALLLSLYGHKQGLPCAYI